MNKKANYSKAELIVKSYIKKKINLATATILLNVKERQFYRLLKEYRNKRKIMNQIKPLVEKRKPPQNKTKEELIKKIIKLYKTKYYGFSHTHFMEKLEELEGIKIPLRTLTRILNNEFLISPYAQKTTIKKNKALISDPDLTKEKKQNLTLFNDNILSFKEIHNRVHHIEDFGALIQLDAREDFYIEKEKWTVHLAIDVASGQFVGAFIDKFETLWGYQNVLFQIITNYGVPKCILTDNINF